MSNKEIIQENNLKLQDCVDLANNLPDVQNFKPVYATTDYRVLDVPKPDGITSNVSYIYNLDMYYLVEFASNYYLYRKNNSGLEYIGKVDMNTSGLAQAGIIGYFNNNVYVYIGEDSGVGNWYLYKYDLNEKTTSLVNSGKNTSYIGNVMWSSNGYFLSGLFGGVFKLNMEDYSISQLGMFVTTNGLYNLHKNSMVVMSTTKKTLNVCNINSEDTIVKTTKTFDEVIYGVNYYKNKIFMKSGIFVLNDDLSLGEKLGDVPSTFSDISYYLRCYNDKYYGGGTGSKFILYEFNEETNKFVEVETLTDNIPSKVYEESTCQPNLYTTTSIYDFTTGDTLIGYKINGQNVYLNQSRNITTDKILSGYTSYTQDGSPISGTMPNNGDVTIAPTISEQVKEKGYYNSLKVSAVTSAIDSNITPENIKKDVSILGINGTLETGTDTSDADATANDITMNKTAYVNGEKITGTLPLFPNSRTFTVDGGVTNDAENNRIQIHTINTTKQILDSNLNMEFNGEYADVADAIGLTADKIKAGETILGITGTYTGENDVSL